MDTLIAVTAIVCLMALTIFGCFDRLQKEGINCQLPPEKGFGEEFSESSYKAGRESVLKNVGMLRQWLNERDQSTLVTNEQLLAFLKMEK